MISPEIVRLGAFGHLIRREFGCSNSNSNPVRTGLWLRNHLHDCRESRLRQCFVSGPEAGDWRSPGVVGTIEKFVNELFISTDSRQLT